MSILGGIETTLANGDRMIPLMEAKKIWFLVF